MEQNHLTYAHSSSASQEFPTYYLAYTSPPLLITPSQMNPVQALPP